MPDRHVLHPDRGQDYSLLKVTSDPEELERFERTTNKYRLPQDVKPCILKLLNHEGLLQILEKWKTPCIIACELGRVGYTCSQVEKRLERWQMATPSQIRSAVRVAFEKEREYACPTLEVLGICLYPTRYDCPWFSQIQRRNQATYRERDFHRFGWPKHLKPSEQCIYFATREIEKKRKMPAGSCLFVNEREMGRVAGLCRKTVRTGMKALKQKGLIEFKSGRRHKHYGIAGEARRIIPIPRPKL